jgi:hypothetical protein
VTYIPSPEEPCQLFYPQRTRDNVAQRTGSSEKGGNSRYPFIISYSNILANFNVKAVKIATGAPAPD